MIYTVLLQIELSLCHCCSEVCSSFLHVDIRLLWERTLHGVEYRDDSRYLALLAAVLL